MADITDEKRNNSNDNGTSVADGQIKEIENQGVLRFSAAAERRLVWKIDLM